MEKFIIELSGKPLVEQEIEDFEARHQVSLPADYKAFLLSANGGMFNPQVHIKTEHGFICILQLYSLNDDRPYDLDRMVVSSDWEGGYKKGYLKIGRDPGGSGIFISTKGSDIGNIYFLDREEDLRPPGGLVKLAESFKQMILALEPLEDEP